MPHSVNRESLMRTRTEMSEAKRRGIHYTPDDLAGFLAERALTFVPPTGELRVLDPACGDGALLRAIAGAAGPRPLQLYGMDTDPDAVARAAKTLAPFDGNGSAVNLANRDFLDDVRTDGSSIFGGLPYDNPTDANLFDVVIANPPYVRTQILGAGSAQTLARDFGLSGRVDLYHAFVVALTLALRDHGTLALLCSNRFLTTRSGHDLRRILATHYELRAIYDLGDTKPFVAAVLPAVIVATKSAIGSKEVPMTSVYQIGDTSPSEVAYSSVVDALRHGSSGVATVAGSSVAIRKGLVNTSDWSVPWVAATDEETDFTRIVRDHTSMSFGDVANVRVGIKTTDDKVFVRSDWDELPEGIRPENEVLLPLLTHNEAARWLGASPIRRVLYPYDLASEKRRPIDFSRFPRAWNYLESYRAQLSRRRYVTEGGREWWEIWVPQRPALWSHPKIVFPDISEEPRFFLDRTGAVVNGDCYWIPLVSETQLRLGYLMLAVANASVGTRFYDYVCGNRLYSGRRRYITQYVERFPIPDKTSSESAELMTVVASATSADQSPDRDLDESIDRLVAQAFGVEEVAG